MDSFGQAFRKTRPSWPNKLAKTDKLGNSYRLPLDGLTEKLNTPDREISSGLLVAAFSPFIVL